MKYIEPDFLATFKQFGRFPSLEVVKSQIDRYKLTFHTEFARAKTQEIHVIGMTHMGDSETRAQDSDYNSKAIIESQKRVVSFLKEINPDLVGMEGFCGDKFSVRSLVLEGDKMWGTKTSPGAIVDKIITLEENPEINQLFQFQKENPHIEFCGVEQIDLLRLFAVLAHTHWQEKQRRQISQNEPLSILIQGTIRLRGLMMLAKLSRHMKNLNKTKGAFPVGYNHLQELTELNAHLGANWKFYNATNRNDIYLPT